MEHGAFYGQVSEVDAWKCVCAHGGEGGYLLAQTSRALKLDFTVALVLD